MTESRDGSRFPPSDTASILRAIGEELKTMSREEFLRIGVKAGIFTPDGKLTEHYRALGESSGSQEQ